LIACAALACDPGAPAAGGPVVRDSAGVRVVESDTADTATGPLAPPERLLRIGAVDGPGSLYRVHHVFLDGEGVGVVEASTGLIRFFDGAGARVGEVGGTGEGPGEFRALWWAERIRGDTLVAFDLAYPTSISVFGPDGGFVRSFVPPRLGESGELILVGAWSRGQIVIHRQGPNRIYSVTTDGEVGVDFGEWSATASGDRIEAYGPRASFAARGGRLHAAAGEHYEVRTHDEAADLLRISRVRRARVPVTDADVEAYMTDWEQGLERAAPPLARRMRELGPPVFPDSMPAYRALLANRDGGFWARRHGGRDEDLNAWDVFDAEGVYLGVIELPPRFQPTSLSDRRVAGITPDELDVEFVEVYAWGRR